MYINIFIHYTLWDSKWFRQKSVESPLLLSLSQLSHVIFASVGMPRLSLYVELYWLLVSNLWADLELLNPFGVCLKLCFDLWFSIWTWFLYLDADSLNIKLLDECKVVLNEGPVLSVASNFYLVALCSNAYLSLDYANLMVRLISC